MIKSLLKPLRYVASDDFTIRLKRWRTQLLSRIPMGNFILRKLYSVPAPKLELEAFGMKFPSLIGLAAGYDRNGTMIGAMEATGFGFVEIGSITPQPQHSQTKSSLYKLEGDHALLYYSEIESAGVEQVIKNIKHHNKHIIVGCNIAKNSATAPENAAIDYLRLFRPLYQYADYFTVNIACNTAEATYVPRDRDEIMAILTPLFEFRRGQNQYRPILLKISPDLTDEEIDVMTDIMLDTPLDGIVACAGTTGRYGLENSKATMHSLGRIPGALCGEPIKRRALEVVRRIHERAKGTYPIIGCGGISTADDVMAMLEAGATLVQIGTEYIYGGGKSVRDIRAGVNERLRKAEQRAAQSPATESPKNQENND